MNIGELMAELSCYDDHQEVLAGLGKERIAIHALAEDELSVVMHLDY